WQFGKHYLNKKEYGTVITINLEEHGQVMNRYANGIDDYARIVIEKLSQIPSGGEKKKFILIGHSMGGLVASYAAENLAEEANLSIDHIFTIATPWQGSPLLDFLPHCMKAKRFHHMTESNHERAALVEK